MFNIFRKSRKYPMKHDEYGRSSRQQAFALFSKNYRPSQISKGNLVAASMKTLLRYFEDWKKQKHRTSRSILKKIMRNNPEFTEKFVQTLANHFKVSQERIIVRMQKPWGILNLSKGLLPDDTTYLMQSEAEDRLEAALRLIYLGEQAFQNSPKQVKQLIWGIITLKNDTKLVVQKAEGQILIRKERIRKETTRANLKHLNS